MNSDRYKSIPSHHRGSPKCLPKKLQPVTYIKKFPSDQMNVLKNYDPKMIAVSFVKGKSGLNNSISKLPNDPSVYRCRSEILIFDKNKVYLGRKQDGSYKIPGGGWEKDEPHSMAAVREAMEEARIVVDDAVFVLAYTNDHGKVKDWVKADIPEKYQWTKDLTELYIGNYAGAFNGHIKKLDQDDLVKYGKFYPIQEVFHSLKPAHQEAVRQYLLATRYTERASDKEYGPIEKHPIKDGFQYTIKNQSGATVSTASCFDYRIKDFDYWLIADVDTKKAHQRNGLASSIIDQIYQDASQNGKGVYVLVKKDNTGAIQFYKHLGFRSVKTYTIKSEVFVVMSKGNVSIEPLRKSNFSS